MKNTPIALMCCLSITSNVLYAHEHHNHAAKDVIAEPNKPTGSGEFIYQADPNWGTLENGENLGPTHGGVAIDEAGLIYLSTDGKASIYVFNESGSLVKTIAPQARGLHQITIRKEGDKEYIYGAQLNAYGGKRIEKILKLDLDGNTIIEIPNEKSGKIPGGFSGMTGVAVAPDGSIFCSIGYGSQYIHKFDNQGKHLFHFGKRGKKYNQLKTPHNLAIDHRFGTPRLLVVDRENRRLVHYDLEGNFLGIYAKNLRRPCAVSFHKHFCAVAELEARVTILDTEGNHISHLGDNPNKSLWANMKVKPEQQKIGLFSAPHGLSFDSAGNLYVQDWNVTGRATKLTRAK
ncbi:NHL repeat-containing protein [Rubritalea tangerina]|uniref:NHL repeat-containing protein n=1 Tax=Rubritalea tangerina TaxID=430798 RepID=A0ABW4Z880_9BACT